LFEGAFVRKMRLVDVDVVKFPVERSVNEGIFGVELLVKRVHLFEETVVFGWLFVLVLLEVGDLIAVRWVEMVRGKTIQHRGSSVEHLFRKF